MSIVAIFFYTISELLLLSSIVAFFYGLKLRKFGTPPQLLVLLLASIAADGLGSINMYYYLATDIIIIPFDYSLIYRLAEFLLCLLFYKESLELTNRAFTVALLIFSIPYFFLITYDSIWIMSYSNDMHTYTLFLFTILSTIYLLRYYTRLESSDPLKDSNFWYVSGLLICFSGSTLISFSFQSLLGVASSAAFILYSFKNIFMIARNILFIKGFHCHKISSL